ncbi:MAG TPA: cytochrome c oxidase subunit II [Mycobacteriales bacterium]|nr:cytochrome c oxidase subunit II [Mycobacteriales bacterium]
MPYTSVFDQISTFEWSLAGAVFALVLAVLAFAVFRYRAAARDHASQETEHPKVELVYAVLLLLVAIGIVSYTSQVGQRDSAVASSPAVHLQVTGFQWCWRFSYVGEPVTVTATCQNGHYPTVVLPAREPIHVTTTSGDVIHSFWIPEFRYKMDSFPHHTNSFDLTIPREGQWLGHCAEFCGLDHATMLFHVKAVSPTAFRAWLHTRATTAAAATGGPRS